VPPRLSPGGFRPFRSAPGQASWDAVAIAFARRALPAPTCPSPGKAPPAPAIVPESMMPEAARERTVSFRARAPLSLRFREYPRPKASLDERDSRNVTEVGTNVKRVAIIETNVGAASRGLNRGLRHRRDWLGWGNPVENHALFRGAGAA